MCGSRTRVIHPEAKRRTVEILESEKRRTVEIIESELDAPSRAFLDDVCAWIPSWSSHPMGHWQSRWYDKAKAAAPRFGLKASEFARVAFKLAVGTYNHGV